MEAFRVLVESYKDYALSLAVSILKDHDWSEDVVQEAFIVVFKKLKSFKFKSSFSTWLYRILVNRCFNELKKQSNKAKASIDDYQNDLNVDNSEIENLEMKTVVNKTLLQMKPDEALVMELFYLTGHSIQEIKKITGFSLSKVKVTLHRGRSSFKEKMTSIFGSEINELL